MTRTSTTKKGSPSSSSTSSRSKSRIPDWPTFYDHEAALVRAKTPNIKHKVLMKRVSSKWRKQKAEVLKEEQEEAEGDEEEEQAQKDGKDE